MRMGKHNWEWVRQFRKTAVKIAEQAQKRKTEPKIFRDKIKEREALEKQKEEIDNRLRELREEIDGSCPHKMKFLQLEERGREDDYGCYSPGRDHVIKCSRCDTRIAEWGESGSFFGVDRDGNHRYGPRLEYFRIRENGKLIDAEFEDD